MTCKGWTDVRKLSLLYTLLHKTAHIEGDILEIGSAWGRSTVLLGLTSPKVIWSIDPHTGGLAYVQKGELQNSYDEFLCNLAAHGLLDRVKILKHTTQEVLSRQMIHQNITFAFAFIDGLHTSEGVCIDFTFAYDRLAAGGVIVFDDYFEPSVKDYAAMIDDLAEGKKAVLKKDGDARLAYMYKTTS